MASQGDLERDGWEVRDQGGLDEIVARGDGVPAGAHGALHQLRDRGPRISKVHLERMSDNHIWGAIEMLDGTRITFDMKARRGVTWRAEVERG